MRCGGGHDVGQLWLPWLSTELTRQRHLNATQFIQQGQLKVQPLVAKRRDSPALVSRVRLEQQVQQTRQLRPVTGVPAVQTPLQIRCVRAAGGQGLEAGVVKHDVRSAERVAGGRQQQAPFQRLSGPLATPNLHFRHK